METRAISTPFQPHSNMATSRMPRHNTSTDDELTTQNEGLQEAAKLDKIRRFFSAVDSLVDPVDRGEPRISRTVIQSIRRKTSVIALHGQSERLNCGGQSREMSSKP
eukprot:TRINITY_DN12051_c0_g2_i1.p4 TRINITY_DN12051_c0_g2~~TRINITY_DN12051_c0_g2_i1.p4  ORF type:complete len:107 (+),score=0.37 TRINITY_DN12051_c0_g2_i1:79-399(+)